MIKESSPKTTVIACAGNSPGGELGDRLARRLQKKGLARMFSIAQVKSRIDVSSQLCLAPNLLVINGCTLGCASECLRQLDYSDFQECSLKTYVDPHNTCVSEDIVEYCFKKIKASLLH